MKKITPELITHVDPKNPISEAYRTLRTNVNFFNPKNPIKVVMVTSSGPSEGKSTTSINLAITLANGKKKTLLVDADMRRPATHKAFKLDNDKGLSDILGSKLGFNAVMKKTEVGNLSFISSGPVPENPSELLSSEVMGNFINEIRGEFDIIVIDCPPTLVVTDATVIGPLVDGVILVVKSGLLPRDAVERSKILLERNEIKILGVVLNDVDTKKEEYYYYYDEKKT